MVASLQSVLLVNSSEVVRHNALRKKKKMVRIMKMRRSLIEKRLRTLKQLLPASDEAAAAGVFEFFRETAEYIACLQAQVKLMRFMVQVLSQNSGD